MTRKKPALNHLPTDLATAIESRDWGTVEHYALDALRAQTFSDATAVAWAMLAITAQVEGRRQRLGK